MGIYDFIPIPEILSATCRKARDHSFEQQHTSPGGAAATSVPIADCSKQLSIYLSIHHGCHCWWCIISASHQVHVPFISSPASGVPPPSNPLHIEPCKPSFWFHQCGVPFGSPHWAADGNRSLCHFASTKNGSFTSFQSWQLHFYGCHTHKKLRRAGVTHSHIVHMGVLAMAKGIVAITNCKGLCVG